MIVEAVHRDAEHRFSKVSVGEITLLAGLGVEGDAHAGVTVQHRSRVARDPSQPNLRQVHLVHAELLESVAHKGFAVSAGDLGENVTTRGLDLLSLPRGTRLRLGVDAEVEITGLRNPCLQIDAFADGLLREMVRRHDGGAIIRLAGVMSVVSQAGVVFAGDSIVVTLPGPPHLPLEPV